MSDNAAQKRLGAVLVYTNPHAHSVPDFAEGAERLLARRRETPKHSYYSLRHIDAAYARNWTNESTTFLAEPKFFPVEETFTSIVQDQLSELLREQEELKSMVGQLTAQVSALRSELIKATAESEVRSLPDVEARREIKEYFTTNHGLDIFPSDVAEALNLDYETVTRLLGELENDGEIARSE